MSSETSVRGRKQGSSPASATMKASEADDDEVSFKISPVLDDNMIDGSGKELVAQRSKRLKRENEEENKKMADILNVFQKPSVYQKQFIVDNKVEILDYGNVEAIKAGIKDPK